MIVGARRRERDSLSRVTQDERPTGALVHLRGVQRRYAMGSGEVAALDGIDLELAPGAELAVVGPSGCGKSTLLNLISAVDVVDAGRIEVCGVDLTCASERELVALRRREIGVVFQAFHLVPNLTARENVALPLALDGVRDDARVDELLERVGLAARAAHYPAQLSGGEQQRVSVARAVVHRPRLLVADEPTGNLDSKSGARVLELIAELRRDAGAALVMATHDREIAAAMRERLHMRDGRILEREGA
ncbi:MAG: ABC transporter ATP-binding protein [Planctomycetes bacterium]|nr:ABC transporter ATP-binding protein [Planctomycetota bacterium]MCB9902914.1 ABC transporter ATP-binding protein [Planctomycetota bacterium]